MAVAFAVLLDTVGIQNYIFSGNRLRENLGASQLVQAVYKDYLEQALQTVFNKPFDLDLWKKQPADIRLLNTEDPFEVGYIGGGNALLLFKDEIEAKNLVKIWTKLLLIHAPGLKTAVAWGKLSLQPERFRKDLDNLFQQSKTNKAQIVQQSTLPRYGFTAECPYSGLSAEVWEPQKKAWVSAVSAAKLRDNQASELFSPDIQELCGKKWGWSKDLENLGQEKGADSHIAIVHIDGNDMGKRFQAAQSLEAIRNLSISVEHATQQAFKIMLEKLLEQMPALEQELNLKQIDIQTILPLRPIIMGGDDITFVSEGRLGIYLTQHFVEAFAVQSASDGESLSACAGVAITKTKYPFFKGYTLAAALCASAKKQRKAEPKFNSWLDFQLAYSGILSDLGGLRQTQFQVQRGNLLRRPYHLDERKADALGLKTLVRNTAQLSQWPTSKIKALREILSQDEAEGKAFVLAQKTLNRTLPSIPGEPGSEERLFAGSSTPYFDMIELRDLYPRFALKAVLKEPPTE